ncbi:MAG TPA: YceI family protein [Flavobacterium sp.]|nr:YceI family protein [Flavobacterium sp.]
MLQKKWNKNNPTNNYLNTNKMTKSQISRSFMILILSVIFSIPSIVTAQNFTVDQKSSTMTIYGTSNLHDWKTQVTKISGELGMNSTKNINVLSIKVPISSLKSGKGIMDGKTSDAFEAKKFPNIIFQLTDVVFTKVTEKESEVTLTGNLTMHGESKKFSIKSMAKITKTGDYQLRGSVPLKMTEFKMKPPTAVMGTIKTGDAVNVKYDITFKK